MSELTLAVAATTAEWATQLAAWVTDHGAGVRLRDHYVFTRSDALEQHYDCLAGDVDSSLMEARLVRELRTRGRIVVGVSDPSLPHTRRLLESLGVDRVVEATAGPAAVIEAVLDVAGTRQFFDQVTDGLDAELDPAPADVPHEPGSCLTVVTGALEGVGATEVAIELAVQLSSLQRTVLVDADLVAPSLAQRLQAPLSPNLNSAVDAVERLSGEVTASLTPVAATLELLGGVEHPKSWVDLVPDDVCDVLDELRAVRPQVVVAVGSQLEDLPAGQRRRHGVARAILAAADRVVVVAEPSPVGIVRLCRWAVDALELTEGPRVHLVFNRSTSDAAAAAGREVLRAFQPAGLHSVPSDPRVSRAAWNGALVARGPFTRAVAALARAAVPQPERTGRRLLPRRA